MPCTFCSHLYEAVHPIIDASKSSSLLFPLLLSLSQLTITLLNLSPTVRLIKDEQAFFTEVKKEPSNHGGEPAKLLPSFFFLQESSPRRNRSRKSRTREIVDRLRLRRAWMIAPLELNSPYQTELNYLKNIFLVRHLVMGVSRYPGLMCRKMVIGLRDYLLHRRMTRTPGLSAKHFITSTQ